MRIHYLQHVAFENPASILDWARQKNYTLSSTRPDLGETFPPLDSFDFLVIMGGPMNIYEEGRYPWFALEKRFIHEVVSSDKKVLGICLGAQLLADVLGGKVTANQEKEIGWFPVTLTPEAREHPLFEGINYQFTGFHWHGDTFAIPPKAKRLAFSEACPNQAFIYDNRAVGLQFHLETNRESALALVENCERELVAGKPFIQAKEQILGDDKKFLELSQVFQVFMENFEKM